MGNHDLNAHVAFGDTNRADSIPDCLAPQDGPVYLEGRLVLSHSFQGDPADIPSIAEADDPLERYRLWDDLAETWHSDDLEVLRFEWVDVVVRSGANPIALWTGAVDTRARVIPEPDLDEAGMIANRSCDLCWKCA